MGVGWVSDGCRMRVGWVSDVCGVVGWLLGCVCRVILFVFLGLVSDVCVCCVIYITGFRALNYIFI